jgi:hypothetical protein
VAFWRGTLDIGLAQAKHETVGVECQRNTAIEVGKCTLLSAGGKIADADKYLVVWNNSQPCAAK